MRAGGALALLAFTALAGCAGDEPANPNLAAPKVLVHLRPDGNVTFFVHGAFGERLYDWLELSLDNVTIANETERFSLEWTGSSDGFYLEASGESGEQLYEARARVDLDPAEGRAFVSFVDAKGKWSEPDAYRLPFGTILERRDEP